MKFKKSFKCVAAAALFAVFVMALVVSGCSGIFQKLDPPGVRSATGYGVTTHIDSLLSGTGASVKKYVSAVSTDTSIVKPTITNNGKDVVMEALMPGKVDVTLRALLTNGQVAIYVVKVTVDDECSATFTLPDTPIISTSYNVNTAVKTHTDAGAVEVKSVTGVKLADSSQSFITGTSFSGVTVSFIGNSAGKSGATDADILVNLSDGTSAIYRLEVQVSNIGSLEITEGTVLYRSATIDFAKYFKENYGLDVSSVTFDASVDPVADVSVSGNTVKVQGQKIGTTSKTIKVQTSTKGEVSVPISIVVGGTGKISVTLPSVITAISNEAELSNLGARGTTVNGGGTYVDAVIENDVLKVTPKADGAGTVTELDIGGEKVYAAVTASGGVKIYGNFDSAFTGGAGGQSVDLPIAGTTVSNVTATPAGIVSVNVSSKTVSATKPGMTLVTASTTEDSKTVDYKFFVTVNNDGSVTTEQVSRFVHTTWEYDMNDVVTKIKNAIGEDGHNFTVTSVGVDVNNQGDYVDLSNQGIKYILEAKKPTTSPVTVKFKYTYAERASDTWNNAAGQPNSYGNWTTGSGNQARYYTPKGKMYFNFSDFKERTVDVLVSVDTSGNLTVSFEPTFPQWLQVQNFNAKLPIRCWGVAISGDMSGPNGEKVLANDLIFAGIPIDAYNNNRINDQNSKWNGKNFTEISNAVFGRRVGDGGHWHFATFGVTGTFITVFKSGNIEVPVKITTINGVIVNIDCLPLPSVATIVNLSTVTKDQFGYDFKGVGHYEVKMLNKPSFNRADGKDWDADASTIKDAIEVNIAGENMTVVGKQTSKVKVYFWANKNDFNKNKFDADFSRTSDVDDDWQSNPDFWCAIDMSGTITIDDWPVSSEKLIQFLAAAAKYDSKLAGNLRESVRNRVPVFTASNRGCESYTIQGFTYKAGMDRESEEFAKFFEGGLTPESLWRMTPDSLKKYSVMELHENKQSRGDVANMELWWEEQLDWCDKNGVPALLTVMAASNDGGGNPQYYTFNGRVDIRQDAWKKYFRKLLKNHPSLQGFISTEHHWTGSVANKTSAWLKFCKEESGRDNVVFVVNDVGLPGHYTASSTFVQAAETYGKDVLMMNGKFTNTGAPMQTNSQVFAWWLMGHTLAWGNLIDTWNFSQSSFTYLGGPSKSRYSCISVTQYPEAEMASYILQAYMNGATSFQFEAPWVVHGYNDMISEFGPNVFAPLWEYFETHPAPTRDEMLAATKAYISGANDSEVAKYPTGMTRSGQEGMELRPSGRYGVVPMVADEWTNKGTITSKVNNPTQQKWDELYPDPMVAGFVPPNDRDATGSVWKITQPSTGNRADYLILNWKRNFVNQGIDGIDNETGAANTKPWNAAGADIQYVKVPIGGSNATDSNAKAMQVRLTPHTVLIVDDDTNKKEISIWMTNYRLFKQPGFDAAGAFNNSYSVGPWMMKYLCGDGVDTMKYRRDTVFTFDNIKIKDVTVEKTQSEAGFGYYGAGIMQDAHAKHRAPYFTGKQAGASEVTAKTDNSFTLTGNGWSVLKITYE